jgi:AraC-like DNA-binding protein
MEIRLPSLEDPEHRDALLGYDPPADVSRLVRCVSHGAPSPLIRWHYHDDYELHYVVATSGKFFVGDYIGHFAPGNLVLVGPRLPHNWISNDLPPQGVVLRDQCIVFNVAPIESSSTLFPEIKEVLPMLELASRGIEFFDVSERVAPYLERIFNSQNITRLGVFFELLGELSRCEDYRLLSSQVFHGNGDEKSQSQINAVVNYISEHYAEPISLPDIAKLFKMSESHFSRVFRRDTGNSFVDFLTLLRINRACQLLMQTDGKISTICYDVGFNNLANFNRRFLEIKNTTPSAFRQQSRSCYS